MQNKSQDAQNPGLWVNGNRMPTNLNEMFPPGQERDNAEANSPMPGSQSETDNNKRKADAELAAKKDDDDEKNDTADNDVFVGKGKVDPRFVKKEIAPDGVYRSKPGFANNSTALGTNSDGVRDDDHSYISKKKQEEMNASKDPAVIQRNKLRKERKMRITARKRQRSHDLERQGAGGALDFLGTPDASGNNTNLDVDGNDPHNTSKNRNTTPMQENTNRSMFLTHLQSMQTNSQNAQNPGLWVNGNRMPVQESLLGAAVRGIGKVANFGYGLGNNLGNGMMNAANTAVSGSPLKRPARYGDAGPVRPGPGDPGYRFPEYHDTGTSPEFNPKHPDNNKLPSDFIRPRPSPGSRPDWAPDYPYPNPSPRPGFDPTKAPGSPSYTPGPGDPGYRPRLPGLINPKPKSPTDITVDDIINPNTGNVSLSTGEANKPGAVTLYPAGQNILNPPAKSKSGLGDIIDRPGLPKPPSYLMRPGTYGGGERRPDLDVIGGPDDPYAPGGSKDELMQRRIMEPIKRWKQKNPDQNIYGKEPLGIIPLQADPNLMNRMY